MMMAMLSWSFTELAILRLANRDYLLWDFIYTTVSGSDSKGLNCTNVSCSHGVSFVLF